MNDRGTPSNITLKDVAALAGVSEATASRAFNGSARRVRDDLQQRVLVAAKKLNYAPTVAAQAVARGQSDVVGLIVHDISDPFFASIAAGAMTTAEAHRLIVTLGSTMRRPERELDYLAALRGQRSRAVVLAGSRVADKNLLEELLTAIRAYEQVGGHVVVISQPALPVDTVVVKNRAGARELSTALVDLGYRRFGILRGPTTLMTARDRFRGFSEGLRAAGLGPTAVVAGGFTRDGGHDAMLEILDSAPDLDCVFAVNDVMAVGAMVACRERGLDIPHDLGLAGFDDISTLRDLHPGLTTVRLPLEEMGRLAMELAATAERGGEPRQVKVAGEVVVRASTPAR